MTNNFNQSVTQWGFCASFLRTMSEFLETVVEKNTLVSSLGSIEIDVLFHGHHWGEPCLAQKSILKSYNNFKCTLWQCWKLFAQSTLKFGKVTVAKYKFGIKHTDIEDQSLQFYKALKMSPCPDKIYTFSYMFKNYF